MTQPTSLPPAAQPRTDPLAIWSLVLGILSWFMCPIIASIIAIILGGQSKRKIAESGGTLTGEGMAQVGIILGWINVLLSVLAIIAIALLAMLGVIAGIATTQ